METEKVALISKSAQKGGKRFDIERPPLPRTNQKPYIFRTLHNSFLYGKSRSNHTVAKSELETDITDLRRISNSKPWRASPQPNCIVLLAFRSARIKRKGERGGGREDLVEWLHISLSMFSRLVCGRENGSGLITHSTESHFASTTYTASFAGNVRLVVRGIRQCQTAKRRNY